MDKRFQPEKVEEKLYHFWEERGYFTPQIDPEKEPFTILLPPPNANDPLHMGHALYVVEDILCRWHRMRGEPTLFLPGTDHAGIETQFVFEKELAKEGKSRFDFDRDTLYRMIEDYVEKNRGIAKEQMKRLGFSLDWTREKYTLDPEILETIFATFRKLHKDGLIYRGERIVNYCPHCGTAFSNLEVKYQERKDYLYYLDYGLLSIATTRPETIFADTAVAVNPSDERYQELVGKEAVIPLLEKKIPIISDELVDPEFGTGALKITPAHDATDFEIGQKHHLPVLKCLDGEGRLVNVPSQYQGLTAAEARKAVVNDLEKEGKLTKKEPLTHYVGTCYRCGNIIEPTLMPQWFVKIKPLAAPAITVVKEGKLKIIPRRFKKLYLQWMENIEDWNISRQIVWGPRIPAWYCLDCNPQISISFIDRNSNEVSGTYEKLKEQYPFEEIKEGLQQLTAPKGASYLLQNDSCPHCGGKHLLQETDTFDTWFSSGQWPLTTLGYPDSQDFDYFYPTSVLDTMWDILFFWVARMVMFGLYLAGEIPFKIAHMHCRVVDSRGQKMSKSRSNVVNPMEMIEKYGADALRMALVFGASPGSDIAIGDDKVRAMRNFANKIWNASRYIILNLEEGATAVNQPPTENNHPDDEWILKELSKTVKKVNGQLQQFRFDFAAETLYHFFWHTFCDDYLERTKKRRKEARPTLLYVLITTLKLLHPFMPFVTEEIWQRLRKCRGVGKKLEEALAISSWPQEIATGS